MKIEIKVLQKDFYTDWSNTEENYRHYLLPTYAKPGDAGLDLRVTENVTLHPGECKLLPTGIAIWIGSNHVSQAKSICDYNKSHNSNVMGMIVPRSSLGTKGLILANTIGIIDEDYQGELMISALNRTKDQTLNLTSGEKICQIIFIPFVKVSWSIVEEFSGVTDRNTGGFGSSGR